MKKNTRKFLSTALLGLTLLSTHSFAATVWREGSNYVTNTERFEYIYDGYGQSDATYKFNNKKCVQVAIRYYGGAEGDTGFMWSPYSSNSATSVSHTYRDTLNPFAPQTSFRYDNKIIPWGYDIQR